MQGWWRPEDTAAVFDRDLVPLHGFHVTNGADPNFMSHGEGQIISLEHPALSIACFSEITVFAAGACNKTKPKKRNCLPQMVPRELIVCSCR